MDDVIADIKAIFNKNTLIYIMADVILKVILKIASAISFHGISPNFQLRKES